MNILVGYASAHGSTAEIAAFIGKVFEEHQLSVTVANVAAVESVDAYDVFVLGSAIHAGMWLTEFSQFLARFEGILATKPVYMFITCIRVLEAGGYQHAIEHYVNHSVTDKLGVREIHPLAGKLEMSAVDWDERWTLAAQFDGSRTAASYNNDFRNWDAIRTWATHVANKLLAK
jgi:menaquinone-dependent protoporphyrinogen oxidase